MNVLFKLAIYEQLYSLNLIIPAVYIIPILSLEPSTK